MSIPSSSRTRGPHQHRGRGAGARAVLPATRSIQPSHLGTQLNRRVRLADGLRTIVDDELEAREEVYFEAGDHENLVHMTAAQFMALLGSSQRAHR